MRRMALIVSCTGALALACGPTESGTDAAIDAATRTDADPNTDAPVAPQDAVVTPPDAPLAEDAPVVPMDAVSPADSALADAVTPPMDARADTVAPPADARADVRADAPADAALAPLIDCTNVANNTNPACVGPSSSPAGSIGAGPARTSPSWR